MLNVKNKVIGEGKPLVCVSVMETKKETIIAETKRLIEKKVEMIEWRVDAFEGVESLNAVREVLRELAPLVKDTILIFTFRSKEQGGLHSMSGEKVYDLHQVAAESKIVDFVDLEYFYTENADEEVQHLQKMGTKQL